MKKVWGQTVRDLKREVNKKVLKVPGVEQKVLDVTSNEPWGPHGSLLADIALATRNYHEYHLIMSVIWKRINDTGKNWRHVYKALILLEYLVANGSDRVIDDIREHSYQLSMLFEFRYIDSNGRDQGNNVRAKAQSLVNLVNNKQRLIEVREKAAANREKFRNNRRSSYEDDSYEARYRSRDEDRYGRHRDSVGDGDYRVRTQRVERFGPRSQSCDMEGDRAFDNGNDFPSWRHVRKSTDGNIGAPPSYEEAVGQSQSPAHSERNGETLPMHALETSSPPAPRSPKDAVSPLTSTDSPKNGSPTASNNQGLAKPHFVPSMVASEEVDEADQFDPRGSSTSTAPPTTSSNVETTVSASPTTSSNVEMDLLDSTASSYVEETVSAPPATSSDVGMDLLGSLSDSFSPIPTATMPHTSHTAPNDDIQPFEDPFGDGPFKAIPPADIDSTQAQTSAATSVDFNLNALAEPPNANITKVDQVNNLDFADIFGGMTYDAPDAQPLPTNSQFPPQEQYDANEEIDILAGILPPTTPSPAVTSHSTDFASTGQPAQSTAGAYGDQNPLAGSMVPFSSSMDTQESHFAGGNFTLQGAPTMSSNMAPQNPQVTPQFNSVPTPENRSENFLPHNGIGDPVSQQQAVYQTPTGSTSQFNYGNFTPQQGPAFSYQTPTRPTVQHNNDVLGNMFMQGSNTSMASQNTVASSTGLLPAIPQPSKEKFQTKSTVWADTLSRGLIDLDISGPKTNPTADIGIDFDAMNRKEKRLEKPKSMTSVVTSTVTMGRAMGAGSGLGRGGASLLGPLTNGMMSSGMGMGGAPTIGMGGYGGMHPPMGMGVYGGMNQPMGMGMGMGMGMNQGMNMGMGMNMGQGSQMQTPNGYANVQGSYNPAMMGAGGYNQQYYGGGYR